MSEKTETILNKLATIMVENNIEPEEILSLLRPEKFPVSKRNAIRGIVGLGAISLISGSAMAGDVSSGQIATQITQTASLRGTDDSEIADLSSNYLDLSPKGFFKMAETAGGSPAGVVAGSIWWDTTI
tara:strand:- start:253 stop:636 length:384 start_codon:yes stop_codon:yes gene_type:complete